MMIVKFLYYCLSLVVLELGGFLIVANNQDTANDLENRTSIECEVENISHWHWSYSDRVNETGTKCNVHCSPKCTCTLDDVTITSNCTSGNVTVYSIIYPSDVRYLTWNNSILHNIKPGAFWRFASSLQDLHLTNVSLRDLQPGAFSELTGVTYLDLSFNQLQNISPGTFREFTNLKHLDLHKNILTEITVGLFRGLKRLETLYLRSNRIIRIAEGVFEDLVQLKRLCLDGNTLSEITIGVFRGLLRLENLYLHSNGLNWIAEGSFKDLDALLYLSLENNNLSDISVGVFRGLIHLEDLNLCSNRLTRIAEGAFADLVQLKKLCLDNNELSEINAGVFKGLLRLEVLRLVNNRLNTIAEGAFEHLENLQYLHLRNNNLSEIKIGVFRGLIQLKYLNIESNMLNRVSEGAFEDLVQLKQLWLFKNYLSEIGAKEFMGLIRLESLLLYSNRINRISEGAFENLTKVEYLQLNNNSLSEIGIGVFRGLARLEYLDVSNNHLNRIAAGAFGDLVQLQTLDLRRNPLLWIDKDALSDLNKTVRLAVSDYATCCFTTVNCDSPSPSPYITCKRLLPSEMLRIAIWFVCSLAIVGNIFVFCTRLKNRRQKLSVQFLLIMNLSISDFIMGIYLIIILATDLHYKEYFPLHSESWRHSILCRIAGALSVLSSEASAFFITLITIDRFLGIKYTLSNFRLGSKSTRIIVLLLWMTAVSISITVFIFSQEDSEIYAVSEICVGLPISQAHIYSKNKYSLPYSSLHSENTVQTGSKVGMYFSIALFTGINLVCFFIVGYCYVAIFIYVKQTTKQSGRSRNLNEEIRMTIRMTLIVFTDFCCWVPISILSIFVQIGIVEVYPVVYAWIATFVLPINSSLNPFLYTFASFVTGKVINLRHKKEQVNAKQQKALPVRANSETGM